MNEIVNLLVQAAKLEKTPSQQKHFDCLLRFINFSVGVILLTEEPGKYADCYDFLGRKVQAFININNDIPGEE